MQRRQKKEQGMPDPKSNDKPDWKQHGIRIVRSGELETVLYIIRGRARFRWGDRLEFVDEAGPGDFIYVPPFVPHQELNARRDQPVEAVVVRSGQEPIVVNLDIPSPEAGPISPQPDPFHSAPGKS